MNYARVNTQSRINREAWEYEREERNRIWGTPQYYPKSHGSEWITWKFGKHAGKTLPEILAADQTFIMEYLYRKTFDVLLKVEPTSWDLRLTHQLRVLCNRAENIRVPAAKRRTHEFAILKDGDGVFSRAIIVRRGSKIERGILKGDRLARRSSTLAFSIPYLLNHPALGHERFRRCFKSLFLVDASGAYPLPSATVLFSDRKSFDLSSCSSHTSLVMTKADILALRKEYKLSLKQR